MQKSKVVPFKAGEGISPTLTQHLLEKGRSYGLNAIFPFSIDKISVAEWVHLKCRYGCNQYNTNWCCPPATPDPSRARPMARSLSAGGSPTAGPSPSICRWGAASNSGFHRAHTEGVPAHPWWSVAS